jgi:hypothetical protein
MAEYDLPDDFEPMSLDEVSATEALYLANLFKFYDVRKRMFIVVDKANITKFTFKPHNAAVRYGLRADLGGGRHAHKFIDEKAWRFVDVPYDEAQPPAASGDGNEEGM